MTLRAMNYTITQSQFNQLAATGGEPRRIARINRFTNSPSVRSFVRSVLNQLIPRSVRNRFRETTVLNHPANVQVFKDNQTKAVNEVATELVREVPAAVGDSFMDAPRRLTLLAPLRFRQCFLIRPKETRVRDLLASGHGCEARQPDIYTDRSLVGGKGLRFYLDREASKPFVGRCADDSERLDLTFNRTVEFDTHVPNLRQAQLTVKREAGLWVGETVVAGARAETGKASLFTSCFHPAKEVLKRLVQPVQHILKHLRINTPQLRALSLYCRKLVRLRTKTDRLTIDTPRVSTFLKPSIEQFTAQGESAVQASRLCFAGEDSVAIGYSVFSHAVTISIRDELVRLVWETQSLGRAALYSNISLARERRLYPQQ